MSKNANVTFDFDLPTLEVTASVTPFIKGDGPMAYSGPTPDEYPEVEDLCVGLTIGGKYFDLTDALPESIRNEIESLCLEQAAEKTKDKYYE